jgi:glycosidase
VAVSKSADARELAMVLESEVEAAAGDLAALALLGDAYHLSVDEYLASCDSTLLDRILAILRAQLGLDLLDRLLVEFAEEYLGATLSGLSLLIDGDGVADTGGVTRSEILADLLVFWLLHSNPAAKPIANPLHTSSLLQVPAFHDLVRLMREVLEREPAVDQEEESLWDFLTRPQRMAPDSLADQLAYIRRHWRFGEAELAARLDAFLGMLEEEHKPRFPPGPGPTEAPALDDGDEARFSSDQTWMSQLALVAKHALVWMQQLSTTYQRPIERLDQIPDEELERLAGLGFGGLWLIGVWQRSPASQTIKQLCGNPEAASSAYSLAGYRVANELGGEAALNDLQGRAAGAGIRLAVDMVPNHTGLDSEWLMDHPDWFIGQADCPFPAYSFAGQDLSQRPDIGVFLEDHYYDRSDAAVVFQRVDRNSGEVRYIYHGNDGTSMPWNDTAQLNYLMPAVRQAMIDQIVAVAQRVPIIRFDAAMTLSKKHYQRLWFPAPGDAGAIPSRADHGMTEEKFSELMPQEFWREVVDRLAEEAPDTLLLAEAFWLMEGYFVRSLGMHRVYNSAFMNMLRDGDTASYRQMIKETLVFEPEILKRYVNFMNNPDESSAVEQFGNGDRYFGTCAVMSTLPGLPMFGHGQVEGLGEKYGMEYRRAYWDESPDSGMVERHARQIAPLLRRRELFAEVENFRLFDLIDLGGGVVEDVLAFANGTREEPVLVLFNNSDRPVHGRLNRSAPFLVSSDQETREDSVEEIGVALRISDHGFWTYRDLSTQREFLCHGTTIGERGLEVDLAPWEHRVLANFVRFEVPMELGYQMADRAGTRGVSSLVALRRELETGPLREALSSALEEDLLQRLMKLPGGPSQLGADDEMLERLSRAVDRLVRVARGDQQQIPEIVDPSSKRRLLSLLTLPELASRLEKSKVNEHHQAGVGLQQALERRPEVLPALFCWVLLTTLQDLAVTGELGIDTVADWNLESALLIHLINAGGEPEAAGRLTSLVDQGLQSGWGREAAAAPEPIDLQRDLMADAQVRRLLGAHDFEGCEYISGEALESLVDWRLMIETLAWSAAEGASAIVPTEVGRWWQGLGRLATEAEAAAYRTDVLGVGEPAPVVTAAETVQDKA